MSRVNTTARRIFQERWLRDNGKVTEIEPAEAPAHHLTPGLTEERPHRLLRAILRGLWRDRTGLHRLDGHAASDAHLGSRLAQRSGMAGNGAAHVADVVRGALPSPANGKPTPAAVA